MSPRKPKEESSERPAYLRPYPYIPHSYLKADLVFSFLKKIEQNLDIQKNLSLEGISHLAPLFLFHRWPHLKIQDCFGSLTKKLFLLSLFKNWSVICNKRQSGILEGSMALTSSPSHTNLMVVWPWVNYQTLRAFLFASIKQANPLLREAGGPEEMENGKPVTGIDALKAFIPVPWPSSSQSDHRRARWGLHRCLSCKVLSNILH